MARPRLVLIHEPEAACRIRLATQGFAERQALEISSYLAQCTDLALEFGEIERACEAHGIDFARWNSMKRRQCCRPAIPRAHLSGR